jgi:AbrB family looped-hinge helix DNA binding protein
MSISLLNNVRCSKENSVRKIDSTGRIIIPKGLRDKLELKDGDEMTFYLLESENQNWIGLGKSDMVDPRYKNAALVLEELGIEIPLPLLQKIKKT